MPRNPNRENPGHCPTCGNALPTEKGWQNPGPDYCDQVCRKAWHRGIRFEPYTPDIIPDAIEPDPADDVELDATADALWHAIAHLAPELRDVVTARHMYGETVGDVGKTLGISNAEVARREQRAIGRLREELEAYAP